MLNNLLAIRENLKDFYKRSDVYLLPILKFLLAFAIFYFINKSTGYMAAASSIFIVIILALVCSILPLTWTVVLGLALIVIQSFGIDMGVGAFAACIYIVLFILFMRFAPQDSIAVLLAPLCFSLGISCVIPITLGMRGKASSALAAVTSVISYSFFVQLPAIAQLKEAGEISGFELLKESMNLMADGSRMFLYIIVFAAVTLVSYLIRKLLTVYGWLTSALVGAVLYIGLMTLGAAFLDVETDFIRLIVGSAISVGIALVIAFFMFSVNYRASRYLQFEDDNYYYYVKAIPKNKPISYDDEIDETEDYFDSEDSDIIKRR